MYLPKEMKKAIRDTIKLHQKALESEYKDYADVKRIHNKGICPLCSYSRGLITPEEEQQNIDFCSHCPWVLIEGCECESEEAEDFEADLDFKDNDEASIERLKQWLVGRHYVLGIIE